MPDSACSSCSHHSTAHRAFRRSGAVEGRCCASVLPRSTVQDTEREGPRSFKHLRSRSKHPRAGDHSNTALGGPRATHIFSSWPEVEKCIFSLRGLQVPEAQRLTMSQCPRPNPAGASLRSHGIRHGKASNGHLSGDSDSGCRGDQTKRSKTGLRRQGSGHGPSGCSRTLFRSSLPLLATSAQLQAHHSPRAHIVEPLNFDAY